MELDFIRKLFVLCIACNEREWSSEITIRFQFCVAYS